MARTITPVQGNYIEHCLLIDLTLDGTTYYISNAYKALTYNSNSYTECGAFLTMGEIQEDIKTTNGDLQIGLTGIPSNADYMNAVLTTPIKGGTVNVYRAFLTDGEIVSANVYQRFAGIITNFNISEDTDIVSGLRTNSIAISTASINTILENKVAGQRTAPEDRKRFFPTDNTFYRVPQLQGVQFDFGREFNGSGGGGGGGYGGGGGGGGGGRNRDRNRNVQER